MNNDAHTAIGSVALFDIFHPVTDALRWMELHFINEHNLDQWTDAEIRQLRNETSKLSKAVGWLPDLYRGMIVLRRNWGYRAGRPDYNQFETWSRCWDEFLSYRDFSPGWVYGMARREW